MTFKTGAFERLGGMYALSDTLMWRLWWRVRDPLAGRNATVDLKVSL